MQRTPDTFLPSCTWHYPPSHCLTCVWHQNSSCNTTCHFPSVQVGILAAPHAWGVVDIPCGWGSESLIRAILVIAKAEVMYPPESYGFLQLWTVGAGFKHTRVFLSSSAIPDFFLQMFKSWISFQRTRNWFWLISCKSQQHAGWTLRESQFKHDHCTERRLWVICLISGFTVHAGLGSGTDQGADARLWASCE